MNSWRKAIDKRPNAATAGDSYLGTHLLKAWGEIVFRAETIVAVWYLQRTWRYRKSLLRLAEVRFIWRSILRSMFSETALQLQCTKPERLRDTFKALPAHDLRILGGV